MLKDGREGAGPCHCLSGKFGANVAWALCATLAHNLLRWLAMLGADPTGSWSQRPCAASCSRFPGGSPPVDAGTPCACRPAGRVMAGLLRAPAVAPARHPNAFVQSGPPTPSRPQLEPPGRGTDALVERAPNQEALRPAPNHHAPTWYRRKAVPLSIAFAVSLAVWRASIPASAVLRSLDPRIGGAPIPRSPHRSHPHELVSEPAPLGVRGRVHATTWR